VPDLDFAAHDQKPDGDCERDLEILSREKNFSFIETIAAERRPSLKGAWAGLQRDWPYQQERFIRERAHQVTLGHHLHPRSCVGDRTADDVATKRTRAQNAQCMPSA